LWKQIVVAKIRAQARNIDLALPAHRKLLALAGEVRSGDPSNVEAQAARVYWQNWLLSGSVPNSCSEELGTDPLAPGDALARIFRRDPEAAGLNGFLNYGYAILRAAIGRAIVAAGLAPSLGIHHRNRSNAFCLADDLIEPLRPLVDDRVRDLYRRGHESLTQPAKAELLDLLVLPMRLAEQTGPLMVMLHRMIASLARCYAGKSKRLEIPSPCLLPSDT
jgi:CRISPR-associated protein Cas1